MESNLCALSGVFLSALCGLVFLTAENAEFRKVNIQKGLAELKEFV